MSAAESSATTPAHALGRICALRHTWPDLAAAVCNCGAWVIGDDGAITRNGQPAFPQATPALSSSDLEEMERLAKAAKIRGPWEAGLGWVYYTGEYADPKGALINVASDPETAQFIAACTPERILALLEVARRGGERSWALSVMLGHIDLTAFRRIARALSVAELERFAAVTEGFKPDLAARDAAARALPAPEREG